MAGQTNGSTGKFHRKIKERVKKAEDKKKEIETLEDKKAIQNYRPYKGPIKPDLTWLGHGLNLLCISSGLKYLL